jgi:hypothetical protein
MSLIDQPLFAVPKSNAGKEIAKLHDRRRELQRQQREELQGRDRARAERDRLGEQVRSTEALALAHDKPANTRRDQTRLAKLAEEVAEHDHKATAQGAAIVAIETEVRQRASAGYDELLDEAIGEHEQARQRITEALQSLAAGQARACAAYAAAQAIASNAGVLHITARMRVVPKLEQITRDGGIDPLINSHDRDVVAQP